MRVNETRRPGEIRDARARARAWPKLTQQGACDSPALWHQRTPPAEQTTRNPNRTAPPHIVTPPQYHTTCSRTWHHHHGARMRRLVDSPLPHPTALGYRRDLSSRRRRDIARLPLISVPSILPAIPTIIAGMRAPLLRPRFASVCRDGDGDGVSGGSGSGSGGGGVRSGGGRGHAISDSSAHLHPT